MIAATRGGLSRLLLSIAVLILAIALVFRYLTPAVPQMADDLPTSIYDITVKDIRGDDIKLSEYAGKVLLIVNVASKCGLTSSNYKELNVLYENYREKGLEILAFPCNQFAGQEPGSNEDIQETVCSRFKAEFPIFDKARMPGAWNSPKHPIFDIWVGDPYLIGWCPACQVRMSTAPYCIPIAKSMMISPWWGWISALRHLGAGTQAGKAATMLQLHWIDVNGKDAAPLYKYLKSQKGGFLGDGIKWNFTKFLVDKDGKVVERYAPTTSPLKIENDIQKLLGTAS